MWYAFFVLGSVWFWLLCGVWLILLTAFVEHEEPWYSFWSVVIFFGLIHLFGDVNFFSYMRDNPWDCVRLGALYVVVGMLWGVAKFYFYNKRLQGRLEVLKRKFTPCKTTEKEIQAEWEDYYCRNLDRKDQQRLELSNQARKIVFWMAYWPVSAFWTLLNDPIRIAYNWAYETILVKMFTDIHNRTVGKGMKYQPVPAEPKPEVVEDGTE